MPLQWIFNSWQEENNTFHLVKWDETAFTGLGSAFAVAWMWERLRGLWAPERHSEPLEPAVWEKNGEEAAWRGNQRLDHEIPPIFSL